MLIINIFKDIDILKPNIKEQEKIALFLNEISQQISLVNEQLEETRTFKKALLSKFGGLAFLGYYEMANKLIYQLTFAKFSSPLLTVVMAIVRRRHDGFNDW